MIVMKGNKAACKGVLLSTRSLLLEKKYWHTLLLKPSESYSKFSFICLVHCASFSTNARNVTNVLTAGHEKLQINLSESKQSFWLLSDFLA